jgi:hypothetical protein
MHFTGIGLKATMMVGSWALWLLGLTLTACRHRRLKN